MRARGLMWALARRFVLRSAPRPRATALWLGCAAVALVVVELAPLRGLSVALAALPWIGSMLALWSVLRPAFAAAVLATALGASGVAGVLAVGAGVERSVAEVATRLHGHVLITEYGLDFDEYRDIEARIRGDARVRQTVPFAFGILAAVRAEREPVRDRSPKVAAIKGVDAVGPWAPWRSALQPAQPQSLATALVGVGLARELGAKVGDRLRLVVPSEVRGDMAAPSGTPRHAEVEVAGVLETGSAEWDGRLVVTHLRTAQALLFARDRVTGVELFVEPAGDAAAIARGLERDLPRRFNTTTWERRQAGVVAAIRQGKVAVSVVVGLIAVVAGGTLASALLFTVHQRRGQLGALAAMGASPRAVARLFHAMALWVGACGLVVGALWTLWFVRVLERWPIGLDPHIYPLDRVPVELDLGVWAVPFLVTGVVCTAAAGPIAAAWSRRAPIDQLRG